MSHLSTRRPRAAVALWLAAAGVLLSALGSAAANAETDLFARPDDFWVGSNGRHDPTNGGLLLYGPTDASASWYVAEWNNPGAELPPFKKQPGKGVTTVYAARANAASAVVEKGPSGTAATILQDNTEMPCHLPSGGPGEFDLLLGMNHRWVNRAMPDATVANAKAGVADRLSNMSALLQRLTVEQVREWLPYPTARCPVNQGNMMVAVVLRDDAITPHQVLYYQLALRTICHAGPTYEQCMGRRLKSAFWWTGDLVRGEAGQTNRNFGYRDTLASYGQDMVDAHGEKHISIDLLPVLTNLLRSGQHGLDTDVSHWRVMSGYYGQNIWGDVGLSSRWSGYGLTAVLR